jgi:hypothetical protein
MRKYKVKKLEIEKDEQKGFVRRLYNGYAWPGE